LQELDAIEGFHAHIYFPSPSQREHAMRMRESIQELFPSTTLGRIHDQIGPHPEPMYQVAFPAEDFGRFVPWLMLNRADLSILVHPLVGDPLPEHTDHAAWLGDPISLRLEVFESLALSDGT
jgi:aromatic ring-cleaving dioxygenase